MNKTEWGEYAQCYDVLNELIPYQDLQKTIIDRVVFNQQQNILDVSCGTGNFLLWAKKTKTFNGEASVIGLDFSEEMLIRAGQKNLGYKYLLKHDLNDSIPFKADRFHQIVSTLTLYTVNNPRFFLLELYRVLKPEGFLILSSPLAGYENGLILKEHCGNQGPIEPWLDAHRSLHHEKMMIKRVIRDPSLAQRLISICEYNRRIQKTTNFYFPQQNELIQLFFDCGFEVLETKKVYAQQDLLVVATKRGEIK